MDVVWLLLGGAVFVVVVVGVGVLVQSMFSTAKAVRSASALYPEAKADYMHWRTMHNNACAAGNAHEAKVFKAKELVVHSTDHPMLDVVDSSGPLMCQPGAIEQKSEEELDAFIEQLESLSDEDRTTIRGLYQRS